MRSLRTKILYLTTCVTVIAVVVVTLTSVLFIRNTEHRKSDQLLLLLCETGEKNLDYYFSSVEKSVQKVASYAEKEFTGLDREALETHCERVGQYFDEIANKTNGVLTYYYRIDPSVSESEKGFWFTNMDGNAFVEHEVTDITRYDTENTDTLVWFTVPKHTGKAIWLPPYITENLDVRVISYNIPIYYRGQFVGVIGIEIDYTVMADQVQSIRLYENGYAFLTDAQGMPICHPRIDLASLPDDEKPVPPEGMLSESTLTQYTWDGVKKVAAWMRLNNGMRLYVAVPQNETDGEWEQLIQRVLIIAAAVLVLTVLLTRVITGNITRPLKQLTEAAKKADEGVYDFKLDYHSKDEVGALTNTFRRMADHMRDHISDLNKRAYVDSLTSVRNKGAFADYVEEMQKKINDGLEKPEFAIGILDCDDLKAVNDNYGHDKGDIYLQNASRLICRVFQHSPVFRIGGDEFAVVLRNDDYRYREELVASFEKAMETANATRENPWEQVHVAMGIAEFDPEQDHSAIDTMRRADRNMYMNKRKTKNDRQE